MSVLAESMDPMKHFTDNPFDLPEADDGGLMDLGTDPDLVDPQLTMLCPGQPLERPSDPFVLNTPFVWDVPMGGSISLFESALPSQDDIPDLATMADAVDLTSPSSAANLSSRRTSKASRASSKSSAPSLSSTSRSTKKRVRKPTRKKQELQQPVPSAPTKLSKEPTSDCEDGTKRNKYLERNRVAASKCRQKKKEWVHELEDTKAQMEAKHVELQREYTILLGEVSMVKNLLMRHASCKDPNIDQWIGLEAKRFVQKSSSEEEAATARRASHSHSQVLSHSTSASASRRASFAADGSLEPTPSGSAANGQLESLNLLSPAPSSVNFHLSPIIKMEEINYDHMPDDMFE